MCKLDGVMRLAGVLVCVFLLWVEGSWGDTLANCTYEDLQGTWVFQVSKGGHDKTIKCSAEGKKHGPLHIGQYQFHSQQIS